MSLTRKHFTAIAAILQHAPDVETVRLDLTNYFATINPHFDRQHFTQASTPIHPPITND